MAAAAIFSSLDSKSSTLTLPVLTQILETANAAASKTTLRSMDAVSKSLNK